VHDQQHYLIVFPDKGQCAVCALVASEPSMAVVCVVIHGCALFPEIAGT